MSATPSDARVFCYSCSQRRKPAVFSSRELARRRPKCQHCVQRIKQLQDPDARYVTRAGHDVMYLRTYIKQRRAQAQRRYLRGEPPISE